MLWAEHTPPYISNKGDKMKYYYNYSGKLAKVLISGHATIVMFDFRTMFFDDNKLANSYLNSIGFYKR